MRWCSSSSQENGNNFSHRMASKNVSLRATSAFGAKTFFLFHSMDFIARTEYKRSARICTRHAHNIFLIKKSEDASVSSVASLRFSSNIPAAPYNHSIVPIIPLGKTDSSSLLGCKRNGETIGQWKFSAIVLFQLAPIVSRILAGKLRLLLQKCKIQVFLKIDALHFFVSVFIHSTLRSVESHKNNRKQRSIRRYSRRSFRFIAEYKWCSFNMVGIVSKQHTSRSFIASNVDVY